MAAQGFSVILKSWPYAFCSKGKRDVSSYIFKRSLAQCPQHTNIQISASPQKDALGSLKKCLSQSLGQGTHKMNPQNLVV
jgi:hypothetical protein